MAHCPAPSIPLVATRSPGALARARDRRSLLQAGLALVGASLASRFARASFAQSARTPRIGFLGLRPVAPWPTRAAFLEGLKQRGWIEGENLAIEWRYVEDRDAQAPARLRVAAEDLVRSEVDLIVAGADPQLAAAQAATTTIPIVLAVGNPVVIGAAAGYERPGGNITGPSTSNVQVTKERLELLREAAGRLSRLGVFWNPSNRTKSVEWEKLRSEAVELGVETISFEMRVPEEIESALASARGAGLDGVMILADPLTHSNIRRFAELGLEQRLPTVYDFAEGTRAGILVSYGTNNLGLYRSAAGYVDKILRGASPAELPIEVPSPLDLAVNQKTAAALGLTVPAGLLGRATEVVE